MLLSVKKILPIKITWNHTDYLTKNIIPFDNQIMFNIINVIDELNKLIRIYLQNLQSIDLSNTTPQKIILFKNFLHNIFILLNLDDQDEFNFKVKKFNKFISIDNVLGRGAEGTVYLVKIVFDNLESPQFIMKTNRTTSKDPYDQSTILLKEYLNYYAIGLLNEFTPNFVNTVGSIACNSFKINDVDGFNDKDQFYKGFCNCTGTKLCTLKNYIFMIPYKGDTIEKILENRSDIIISNFHEIILQIIYSFKIAFDKLGFIHNDLNLRNISMTELSKPVNLEYYFNDSKPPIIKSINTKYKVNIFDFGGSNIKKFDFIDSKDKKLSTYYQDKFNSQKESKWVKLAKELLQLQSSDPKRDTIIAELLTVNDLAQWYDLTFTKNQIKDRTDTYDALYGENFSAKVLGSTVTTDPNEFKKDIKTFVSDILRNVKDIPKKQVVQRYFDIIESSSTYDDLIMKIENIDITKIIKIDDKIKIDKYLEQFIIKRTNKIDETINMKLDKYLSTFKLQDIKPKNDISEQIDIDGYDADKLYGPTPNFNIDMIGKKIESYNLYGNIDNAKCNKNGKEYEIYFGNPGYTKYFNGYGNIYFSNVLPSELIQPERVGDNIEYTYAFVVNKYTKKIDIRYGRILNLTEIGAKHSIIADNDVVITSGELVIRLKSDNTKEYIININSSKMSPENSRLNEFNDYKPENSKHTQTFYYILMITFAFNFFKNLEPNINLKIAQGIKIKYGQNYDPRAGEKLFKYYTFAQCPNDSFIKSFYEFGKNNEIENACIGIKDDKGNIQNMKQYKFNGMTFLGCDWQNI